jgi:hypothetical protein
VTGRRDEKTEDWVHAQVFSCSAELLEKPTPRHVRSTLMAARTS